MNIEVLLKILLVLAILALTIYLIEKLAIPLFIGVILGLLIKLVIWLAPKIWYVINNFTEWIFNLMAKPYSYVGIELQYHWFYALIIIPISIFAYYFVNGRREKNDLSFS